MPKNVLLYARYSTDRQDQVSIETQVELGTTFNDERGWKLVEVLTDAAVSGTSFKSRPGIQALLKRCERGDIDIVLCVTLDRISRDVEHSAGILKMLNRPVIASLDDMVDELEVMIAELRQELEVARTTKPVNLADDVTAEMVERVINAVMYYMREHADTETKQPFVNIIRGLIQQVVIGPAKHGNGVELYVHGAIVSILATMDTIKAMEAEFRTAQEYEFHNLIDKGVLDTEAKRDKFLSLCAEELEDKRREWKDLQVSVVAGAGFEPATFRL